MVMDEFMNGSYNILFKMMKMMFCLRVCPWQSTNTCGSRFLESILRLSSELCSLTRGHGNVWNVSVVLICFDMFSWGYFWRIQPCKSQKKLQDLFYLGFSLGFSWRLVPPDHCHPGGTIGPMAHKWPCGLAETCLGYLGLSYTLYESLWCLPSCNSCNSSLENQAS